MAKTLRARKHQYLVNVARETVTLDLSIKVDVPLHQFREHIKDLAFEVEIGEIRPIKKGERS